MRFKSPNGGGRTCVDRHTDRLHDAYVALAGVLCERALNVERDPSTDVGPLRDYVDVDNILAEVGVEDEFLEAAKDFVEGQVQEVFQRADVQEAAIVLAELMLSDAPLSGDKITTVLTRMLPRKDNPPIWIPLPDCLSRGSAVDKSNV